MRLFEVSVKNGLMVGDAVSKATDGVKAAMDYLSC